MSHDDDADRRRHRQDTFRAMLAAFNAGDPAGLLAHCATDVVYEAPYYAGMEHRQGREVLGAMLAAVSERFDHVDYRVTGMIDALDPDIVIAEVRGDHPVRGTDRRYQNHYLMIMEFRDDLVVRWRELSNPDEYRRAVLGI